MEEENLHDWWMLPLEKKCKTLRFVASGALQTERSPLVFPLPSMTAEASRPERREASPVQERLPCRSAVRTSAEQHHYLNETTGNVREVHINMIEKEGVKGHNAQWCCLGVPR